MQLSKEVMLDILSAVLYLLLLLLISTVVLPPHLDVVDIVHLDLRTIFFPNGAYKQKKMAPFLLVITLMHFIRIL